MKRFLPSTLLGKLALTAVLMTLLFSVLIYCCFDLLIPAEWGGATQ